ncbi:MAG TPA: hypothetical protein VEO00_10030 [Actinomycetota bacterium]|nr:hypothetical protein [Actinomycetota bacterium]
MTADQEAPAGEPVTRPRRFSTARRAKVALQAAAAVLALVAVKLIVHHFDLEFIELSPLYTSIVAGGIFVIGLLVAGTLADYKESERMPAEIAASLESIYEDCRSIHEGTPAFDLARLRSLLGRVVSSLRYDLADPRFTRHCLDALREVSASFLELERLGVPANYVVRLRTEQGSIRRNVLRVYHIQRTDFLPSGYLLIQTMVVLILAALVFTKIEPLSLAIVVLVFLTYFFVYLERLLRLLDRPFRLDERTPDDVSLFLLDAFAHHLRGGFGEVAPPLERETPAPPASGPPKEESPREAGGREERFGVP